MQTISSTNLLQHPGDDDLSEVGDVIDELGFGSLLVHPLKHRGDAIGHLQRVVRVFKPLVQVLQLLRHVVQQVVLHLYFTSFSGI